MLVLPSFLTFIQSKTSVHVLEQPTIISSHLSETSLETPSEQLKLCLPGDYKPSQVDKENEPL